MLILNFTPTANRKIGETSGTGYLDYYPETKRFLCEVSEAGIYCNPKNHDVIIKNTVTKNEIRFEFTHVDTDDGDIQGWNFKSIDGAKFPCALLIIND